MPLTLKHQSQFDLLSGDVQLEAASRSYVVDPNANLALTFELSEILMRPSGIFTYVNDFWQRHIDSAMHANL